LEGAIDTEFNSGSYFRYIFLKDMGNMVDKKSTAKDKINGKFNVKKAPKLSEVDRLHALSNDDMIYYIF